jgi:O-antigen polymerase
MIRWVLKYSSFVLIVGILLLTSLLACAEDNRLFDFTQSAKFFYFSTAMCIIMPVAIINTWLAKQVSLNKIDLLLFFALLFVSLNRFVFQAVNCFTLAYYELVELYLFYNIIRYLPSKFFCWLLLAVIAGASIQAGYGNLQSLGYYFSNNPDFKITGNFFNPGPFAGYLSFSVPLIWGLSFIALEALNKPDIKIAVKIRFVKYLIIFLASAASLNIAIALYAAESRAAFLAAIAGLIFLFGARFRKIIFRKYTCSFVGYIGFACLLILLSFAGFKLYLLKKDSADGRLFINRVSLNMIKARPFIGVGFAQYKAGYMEYQAAFLATNQIQDKEMFTFDNDCAFNEAMQFTVENGVTGLAILLVLIVVIAKAQYRAIDMLILSVMAAMLAAVVFSFFSYPSQILPIKLNFTIALAILASYDTKWVFTLRYTKIHSLVILLACLIVVFVCQKRLAEIKEAYSYWGQGNSLSEDKTFGDAAANYKKAQYQLGKNGYFLEEYGHALKNDSDYYHAVQVLSTCCLYLNNSAVQMDLGDCYRAIHDYKRAEIAYKTANSMAPGLFYPQYALVKLYFEVHQIQKGILLANAIILQKPKKNTIAYHDMLNEIIDLLNSATAFKK